MPGRRRRKVQSSTYLTGPQIDNLKLISEHTLIPVAVLVREGIDLVLKKHAVAPAKEVRHDQASEEDDGA